MAEKDSKKQLKSDKKKSVLSKVKDDKKAVKKKANHKNEKSEDGKARIKKEEKASGIKAFAGNVRYSPRKMRLVVNLVRGMAVDKAIEQLKYLNKKGAPIIVKLIESAIANAENNYQKSKENLYIDKIWVDEDLRMKRWRPRAMGRAAPILKKMSKVAVILRES